MQKANFLPHKIALIALFGAGNCIITFPLFKEEIFTFAQFSVSTVLSVGLSIGLSFVKEIPKTVKYILLLPLSVIFIKTCLSATQLTTTAKLPNSVSFVSAVLFLLLCLYAGLFENSVLLKLSLICAVVLIALFVLLFPFSLNAADINLSKTFFKNDNILRFTLIFAESFCPLVTCTVIFDKKTARKSYISGAIFGSLILSAAYFSVAFLLGKSAALVQYPFISATGVISFGRGFCEFSGIGYVVCLITVFIKSSVIIHALKKIIEKADKRFSCIFFFVLCAVTCFICVCRFNGLIVFAIYYAALAIIFAVTLFLIAKEVRTAVLSQARSRGRRIR